VSTEQLCSQSITALHHWNSRALVYHRQYWINKQSWKNDQQYCGISTIGMLHNNDIQLCFYEVSIEFHSKLDEGLKGV